MVNLDKWSVVEHNEVKVGDRLKVVVVSKGTSPVLTKEVYKGRVTSINCGDIYLSDHSAWEDVEDDNEVATIYRRNEKFVKPFKLPTELGAIISGVQKGRLDNSRIWMVFDGADWTCTFTTYNPTRIEEQFEDLRIERKGIKKMTNN